MWKEKKQEKVEKVIEIKILEKINYFLLFGFVRKWNENEREKTFSLFGFIRKRKENNTNIILIKQREKKSKKKEIIWKWNIKMKRKINF